MKRAALCTMGGLMAGSSLAALISFPCGWNLLIGAAAATFAAISLAAGWSHEPDPDGNSGNEERRLP